MQSKLQALLACAMLRMALTDSSSSGNYYEEDFFSDWCVTACPALIGVQADLKTVLILIDDESCRSTEDCVKFWTEIGSRLHGIACNHRIGFSCVSQSPECNYDSRLGGLDFAFQIPTSKKDFDCICKDCPDSLPASGAIHCYNDEPDLETC